MNSEEHEQFEGHVAEVVLKNDWLISIFKLPTIQINGQDFFDLPLIEFIPTPI